MTFFEVILTNPTTPSIILHSDRGFTSTHKVRYFTKSYAQILRKGSYDGICIKVVAI